MCLYLCRWYYNRFLSDKLLLVTTTASASAKHVRVMELFVHCLNSVFRSPVFGESDEIYITTVLGLDRGNTFDGATVLILGGGDGGLLHTLTSLPKPPRHVLMAEVSFACRAHALNKTQRSVSRCGSAVRFRLRLSFLFKSCGVWTLFCDFVPHNYETLKWLSSLPILMRKSTWL